MMLDAATPEQRARMSTALPEDAIALWREVGVPELAELQRRLP
jgi:hypothetical protein